MKLINKAAKKQAVPKAKPSAGSFPVVAIGASAGGLEAVTALLQSLTANTGMAFIFVQHLSREHKSMLPSLLARSTKMKVQVIEDTELMKPDNVYVIPYNKNIRVTNGHIQLIPRPVNVSTNLSIDVLFSSLAKTHKANVIGIILSGNASDGTIGLKAIKKAGGITFAQDESAKYSSMPLSAISVGVVDHVLSPEKIAKALIRHGRQNNAAGVKEKTRLHEDTGHDSDAGLDTIFSVLHKSNGVDFSHYKLSTIRRRILRRIRKHDLKTMKEYAKLVIHNEQEAELLYADLLINVTGFFRDTETFRYLKATLLPKLLKDKKKGETLRIWVPACSTGQEAYSIAMLIAELQDKRPAKIAVQIFATDLSEQAIRSARLSEYSKGDLKAVSAARIERFFTGVNGRYRITQELRDMCVFGTSHNILRDPPFSRMDFISCRNLMIYFDSAAQKKVLATLHFSLNDKGYLMLGKSETIGSPSQHFTQVNNKFKIYSRKKNTGARKVPGLTPRFVKTAAPEKIIKQAAHKISAIDPNKLDHVIDSILLSDYMPACAIINKDMEILQFRGSTSLFLSHASGKATLNILKMTRPEFTFELRNAIHKAIKTKQLVQQANIEIKIGPAFRMMSIEVSPVKIERDEPLLLIVFTLHEPAEVFAENGKPGKKEQAAAGTAQKDRRIKKLQDELNHARTEIHTVIEAQETAYEELQTANEEIVSSNEEFQTLNEELESTKEEIEAANDELIATNKALLTHNALLVESYSYSQTIIATIHEPMIVLDSNLHVKSANKSFYKKFHVTTEETEGKPLFRLGNKQWDIPRLRTLLETLLTKNTHFENFEVTHVFPGLGEKIMLLNASRIIQKTHREKLILLAIKDITERSVRQRESDSRNKESLRIHQQDKLTLEKAVKDRTLQLELKNIELENANKELSNANKELIFQNGEKEKRTAELGIANTELAFQNDEKGKRAAELGIANTELAFQNDEKEKRAAELSIANQALTSFTYISSHDLQEPLRKIQVFATCILKEEEKNLSDSGKNYFKRMMNTASRMQNLIEDLLTYSRTKSGDLVFEKTDLNLIMRDIKMDFEETFKAQNVTIQTELLCDVSVIPFQFRQLLQNLVSNSLKFSRPGVAPVIVIKDKIATGKQLKNKSLQAAQSYCHISYADNGIGFDPQYKDLIFEVFQRLHSTEQYTGTGIGLAICRRIVENHNGLITATGRLDKGAVFDIYIPVI